MVLRRSETRAIPAPPRSLRRARPPGIPARSRPARGRSASSRRSPRTTSCTSTAWPGSAAACGAWPVRWGRAPAARRTPATRVTAAPRATPVRPVTAAPPRPGTAAPPPPVTAAAPEPPISNLRPPPVAGGGRATSAQVIYLTRRRTGSANNARGAWLLVAAALAWNLVSLRATTLPVSYLDDASVHEQMVRFATDVLRRGHLPLTSWFPFLGLGSPQFLHYQSLPATLAGLVGLLTGPDGAFRWSLYLILALWPISVFAGARLFGADRWAAAAAAAMAPFLVSATGIGYEQSAYVWTGYGVWTQLWASLTLPLAWGRSWRAIRDG